MKDLEIPLGKRTPFYRFFEMLPALLSYLMISMQVLLSLINPLLGVIFVIVYIIVWFVKALGMSIRVVQGYQALTHATIVKWRRRLDDLEDPEYTLQHWDVYRSREWKSDIHRANLRRLLSLENAKKPSNIYNVVIIPSYNESRGILEPTVQAVLASDYDMQHLILVLAYEQRGGVAMKKTAEALQKKYATRCKEFMIVEHPEGLPNEVVGKGSNLTYAGYKLQRRLKALRIAPENVIVTTLDADNRPHPTYFAYVTYEYIVHPSPERVSFQPMSLYFNNIWDAPAPMRLLAFNNSFWNIIVSQRPEMLRNFSSHSQGMAPLIAMNFWSTRTIVEDGHQFWRSYFYYDGDYRVVPVYVPIYQDAVLTDTYVHTLKEQFLQLRRWAYGASDIPYVAERVLTHKRTVPFFDGLLKLIRLIDSHVGWASATFILLFGGFIPLIVGSGADRSIAAHQLPEIASIIQRIALIGVMIFIVLSFKLLPPRPKHYTWRRNVAMLAQWILAPVIGVVYSGCSALTAQTRLLLGRYLDTFDVTKKAVAKPKRTQTRRAHTK